MTDFSRREELANSLTHGLGAVLAVAALAVLVVFSARHGTVWHVVSGSIYGASMVALYLASTLYHGLTHPRAKQVFHTLDHIAIYLLIAGTYTPFVLVALRGAWGWSLFGVIWGLALAGTVFKAFFTGRFGVVSTLIYVLMGWMIVIALRPLARALPAGALGWLVAGGLCYTVGAGIYAWKRWPYHHAVWHLLVLGGSACHYVAILRYVVLGAR